MQLVKSSQSKPASPTETAVRTFESATAEVLARREAWKERGVLYVLAGMIVFIIGVISVVKLDRIVTAPGRLVPVEGALTVQPLQKAIISRVLVSVGQVVRKGQVLATCDPTFVRADLAQLKQKVADLDAQCGRMEAEEAGQLFHAKPAQPYNLLQAYMWRQRNTEFTAAIAD